eukprot:gnl/MRDRNA2_/MRDRNA2_86210_c0_seq1.p1 gnl/MRDRNA2_/MRDRNA2_86210_c0~~gnl/MRDRNA2_/MRDRNA2_86210_c0_seq1.p1  ORF type:complete len:392 (+),score=54.13 gnl/MRDRNA2_/MRDRNA2_86210_c0_seq1:57-1232(+)
MWYFADVDRLPRSSPYIGHHRHAPPSPVHPDLIASLQQVLHRSQRKTSERQSCPRLPRSSPYVGTERHAPRSPQLTSLQPSTSVSQDPLFLQPPATTMQGLAEEGPLGLFFLDDNIPDLSDDEDGFCLRPLLQEFAKQECVHRCASKEGAGPKSVGSVCDGQMNPTQKTKDVSSLRHEYGAQGLDEATVPSNPIVFFHTWFNEATASGCDEPNAMCLSTVDPATGRPSSRYVLLKGFDENGFVWYTNYGSRKAHQLEGRPFAALAFWWAPLERSVRVEGHVTRVTREESEAYFRSRPRQSQLGALVSEQSKPIESREVLEARMASLQRQYMPEGVDEKDLPPLPMPDWGGYRLEPDLIEFWKGKPSRVHDRLQYTRTLGADSPWRRQRLQP